MTVPETVGSTPRVRAHPFIKWVGGKTQLIRAIDDRLPRDFASYDTYVEPFVGGGAFLFLVLQQYASIKRVVINDLNARLMTLYRVVRDQSEELIARLRDIEERYRALKTDERKVFFLRTRERFNRADPNAGLTIAADFIFLNR